jgi:methanethiol S-methyltransferase
MPPIQDPALDHYGNWVAVVLFIVLGVVFLMFTPFYKKAQRKPAGVFIAFVVAFALEMFGIPMSIYLISALFGRIMPDGIFWGHTLNQYLGYLPMYIAIALYTVSLLLVVFGWREIYQRYWSKDEGKGELVTTGIYRYIRHPQYTGFLLGTLGMLIEWATIPMLIMWPILAVMYYRLARKEEADMEREFGAAYRAYKAHTSMFIPLLKLFHDHHEQTPMMRG